MVLGAGGSGLKAAILLRKAQRCFPIEQEVPHPLFLKTDAPKTDARVESSDESNANVEVVLEVEEGPEITMLAQVEVDDITPKEESESSPPPPSVKVHVPVHSTGGTEDMIVMTWVDGWYEEKCRQIIASF